MPVLTYPLFRLYDVVNYEDPLSRPPARNDIQHIGSTNPSTPSPSAAVPTNEEEDHFRGLSVAGFVTAVHKIGCEFRGA